MSMKENALYLPESALSLFSDEAWIRTSLDPRPSNRSFGSNPTAARTSLVVHPAKHLTIVADAHRLIAKVFSLLLWLGHRALHLSVPHFVALKAEAI